MKLLLILSAVVAFALGAGMTAQAADTPASVRATLQRLYHGADIAIDRKDPQGMTENFDPDATVITTNGETISLDKAEDGADAMFKLVKSVSRTTTILRFMMGHDDDGNETATVTTRQFLRFVIFSPQGQKLDTIAINGTRDYWVQSVSGWSIKQQRTLTGLVTVNGHKVKPPSDNDADPGN